MTLASDQNPDKASLSPTAQRMLDLRDSVFAEWEKQVRSELPSAGSLRKPILINTLPAFYDNIAEAISPDYPRVLAGDGSSLAAEHGGERARITNYDYETLISEYQLFRKAIFCVLERVGVDLSLTESMIINASIDVGIREAVNAFAQVHSGLRERFAAALTHDLRGPLATAFAAMELIVMANDPIKAKYMALKALDNLRRMDQMISELLDTMTFHGGSQLDLELSNFDVCLVLKEIQVDMPAPHAARMRLSGKSVHGWWDRMALRRAVENIVNNAFKYGRADTIVTVHVVEAFGRLMLSVHNDGEPIPLQEQEAIFQMYRRAEAAKSRAKQGWGVGLPYVRAIAESHGGSVAVESTSERGTTFMIDIPVDCRPLLGAPTLT